MMMAENRELVPGFRTG